MSVQVEMGCSAEMVSVWTPLGPSSVSAMTAMRWLWMEGLVLVSAFF